MAQCEQDGKRFDFSWNDSIQQGREDVKYENCFLQLRPADIMSNFSCLETFNGEKYESVLVTEKTDYSAGNTGIKTYYMCQINRKEPLFVPTLIANSCKSLVLIIKEKPKVMITTGVLAVIPLGPSYEIVWRKADIYRIICQGMFQKSDWQFVISFRGSVLCAVGRNAEIISQGNLQRGNIIR